MGVIYRFGLDWKKENRKKESSFFYFVFRKENVKNRKKIALGSDFT